MTSKYTLFKKDLRRCIPPLGLLYIASSLEKDYEVKILDVANEGYDNKEIDGDFTNYGLSDEKIKKEILSFKPDVVGVSNIFSTQFKNMLSILDFVKSLDNEIITLTGGSHPTFLSQEVIKNKSLDYLVMGEGEIPTLNLLNSLNNGEKVDKIVNSELSYVKDINTFPFPARHLLNMEQYFKINKPQNPYPKGKRVSQIITSRGCTAKCGFCSTTKFWGNRHRSRNVKNIIEEIRELKENYKVDEIQFTDDNITNDKNRARELFDAIKKFDLKYCCPQGVAVWSLDEELLEKMYDSGCYQLTFAIENANQEFLNKVIKKPLKLKKVKPLVKKAQKLGIKVHSFSICGYPGETYKNMYDTYDFIRDCGFDSSSFFVASPLIGTKLLEICKKNNYLTNENFVKRSFKLGNITTPEFEASKVQELVASFNERYNSEERGFKKCKY